MNLYTTLCLDIRSCLVPQCDNAKGRCVIRQEDIPICNPWFAIFGSDPATEYFDSVNNTGLKSFGGDEREHGASGMCIPREADYPLPNSFPSTASL